MSASGNGCAATCQLLAVAVLQHVIFWQWLCCNMSELKVSLYSNSSQFQSESCPSSSLQLYPQRMSLESVRDKLTVSLSVSTFGSRGIREVFYRMPFVSVLKYFLSPNE
jgi:hypothetical protein